MNPPYCCAIQSLLHNLATHSAEQSEGKGGEARHGSAPLLLCNRVPQGFYASTVTAWGEYTTILYQRPLSILYDILSLTNSTLL
jgi:hypothetical protein